PRLYISMLFFSSRRRHTRSKRDWSSDVCSSDLTGSSIHHGLSTGIFSIRIKVLVVLLHVGVQAVDDAFIAATVTIRIDIPQGRIGSKLCVLKVSGNRKQNNFSGAGIDRGYRNRVGAKPGASFTCIRTKNQNIVTA